MVCVRCEAHIFVASHRVEADGGSEALRSIGLALILEALGALAEV